MNASIGSTLITDHFLAELTPSSSLNPSSSTVSLHQQRQQQILPQQINQSPQDIYPPQKPTDPVQIQQLSSQPSHYTSYHPQPTQITSNTTQSYLPYSGGPSGSSSRQDTSNSSGRSMSAHRTTGSGSIAYSAGDSASTSSTKYTPSSSMQGSSIASGDRKYNHPNSLPTYNSSTVNQSDPYAGAVGSTNGRYLAPWGIFAVDWCKWPVSPGGNGLGGFGRVAIGSYSEDSHNCVGDSSLP